MFLEGVSRERDRFDSILRRNREKKSGVNLNPLEFKWNRGFQFRRSAPGTNVIASTTSFAVAYSSVDTYQIHLYLGMTNREVIVRYK